MVLPVEPSEQEIRHSQTGPAALGKHPKPVGPPTVQVPALQAAALTLIVAVPDCVGSCTLVALTTAVVAEPGAV